MAINPFMLLPAEEREEMVETKYKKGLTFAIFLLPATVFYVLFFIIPLIQGVQYSFTDWNGIIPVIPFSIEKNKFEHKVLPRLGNPADAALLRKFYRLSPAGESYNLVNWVADGRGQSRPLSNGERDRLRRILKQGGISNIHFVGLENYKEILARDPRFLPKIEKRSLFNEFDDLPSAIPAGRFRENLLNHLKDRAERNYLLSKFHYEAARKEYVLAGKVNSGDEGRLRKILAREMYESVYTPNVVGFTLFFTFFNVILANLIAFILALILDTRLKTRLVLRSIFFLSNILSLVVVAFIWHFLFLLVLPKLTGIDLWLGSTVLAPWAVVMVSVWQSCGWLMVIYLAGLQTIPVEYGEAAQVDGARWFQQLRYIKLPLLLPAFTICLFYSLANSLKSFDIIFALTQGNPAYSTVNVVLDIYYNAFSLNRFGYATAKAVLLCLVIMTITGVQLYLMKRREVEL